MPAADQGSAQSPGRYQLVPRVLCFVLDADRVLLLRGAPDKKIWPGRYNGLGGHVERGESIQAAAEREILEESGLRVSLLRLRGVITIDTGAAAGIGLYVFTAQTAGGALTPSAEGSLEWVPRAAVAQMPIVPDVAVLLERLAGRPESAPPFSAHYHYDQQDELVVIFDTADQNG
ncbi:MAG: NUDIX domain-containing protein [Anaerolineales bacterium]